MKTRRGELLGRITSRFVIAGFAFFAWGCQSDPTGLNFVPPRPVKSLASAPPEPQREVELEYFSGTKDLFFLRELLVLPDGRSVRHGREVEWYKSGAMRHERFFDRGKPAGLWRSWYPDGAQRAAIPCDPGSPRATTWWHENGRTSSQGMSVAGLKQGAWTHWYAGGAVAEQGSYAGGLRQGEWTLWYENGALRARGSYRNDVRVGPWQWWTPEGRVAESSDPAPAFPAEDAPRDQ